MRGRLLTLFLCILCHGGTWAGEKYNFNTDWLLSIGDDSLARDTRYVDTDWEKVTLPHAFNEDEAYRLPIDLLTDTVVWYRKHFRLPAEAKGKKVFIEFEGVRQAADVYLNGEKVGCHENGVMAFGFDLTPYIDYKNDNVVAVRVDNDWFYEERASGVRFQWNDRNFNANYGGITKNVWLHVTDRLYQTLPLYSNLGTTGVYVYAKDLSVTARTATIVVESEIKNEYGKAKRVTLKAELHEPGGKLVKTFSTDPMVIAADSTVVMRTSAPVSDLHFWSWGYGYLYDLKTTLWIDGKQVDETITRTGFRKTRFGEGKVWLNDRVIQLKGFAQRTTNEWPAVGNAIPAWLSDYSNHLMVEANGNLVRWMHFTPSKQDVESCDRVGLLQAMPAGDAEKDREGRQWEQRKEVMRDAIIYNRNNPSILFYECGNKGITEEHMNEMKTIRDQYDPYGGRAIGSREMLDSDEAEYGGEMLYVNKSAGKPMWAMEYCRDEAYRMYWDESSFPYHEEGEGTLAHGTPRKDMDYRPYNHNQDMFAVEQVARWFDYWRERPGTGERVSAGGAKIIFSDTNTHFRGAVNYRTSGDVDAMRIPKDAFFAHQVMWDGWVDTEKPRLHIVGHWNYEDSVVKPVYVVANTDNVELRLNGRSLGFGRRSHHFLFTFDGIKHAPGELLAIGYDETGKEVCRDTLETAGEPEAIRLTAIQNPKGWKADGADLALIQVEVVDHEGRRCPLANNPIQFRVDGPAEWRGGIALGKDNNILSTLLPVEAGVNRAFVRSLPIAGTITITARAEGLQPASLTLATSPIDNSGGLSKYNLSRELPCWLTKGETPLSPSYHERVTDVHITTATAGAHQEMAVNSYDENEQSEWRNDGKANSAWISYHLDRKACVDEVCIKLTGWRQRSYPLEIFAGDELIWKGNTDKSLGYVHLPIEHPVLSDTITIRLAGVSEEEESFAGIVELATPVNQDLDLYKAKDGDKVNHELRIVEVEFKEHSSR